MQVYIDARKEPSPLDGEGTRGIEQKEEAWHDDFEVLVNILFKMLEMRRCCPSCKAEVGSRIWDLAKAASFCANTHSTGVEQDVGGEASGGVHVARRDALRDGCLDASERCRLATN